MKMFNLKSFAVVLFLLSGMAPLFAQPGGGRRGGFDPDEMIKREKQNVTNAITDLSDDQQLLLDGIYDEFLVSFKELRDEVRQSRDYQSMRPKMQALRTEKDELIKDVLNEEQFNIYMELVDKRRQEMKEARERRGGGRPKVPADTLSN